MRALTIAAAASVAVFVSIHSFQASAQTLFQTPSSSEAAAATAQPAPTLPQAVRSRIARLNRTVVTRHLAPAGVDQAADRIDRASKLDGVLTLNLFPDVTTTFRRSNISVQDDGGYVWEGVVPGQPVNEALLLITDKQIVGQVQLAHRIFRIDPVSGDLYRITEIDQSKFPPESAPLIPPGQKNYPS